MTPAELIQACCGARSTCCGSAASAPTSRRRDETHAEAGDRANDAAPRRRPRAARKVVGEGANLGVTQRGRIEFAPSGGRINTDAIDNSAGVDTSDHEVNIKILLDDDGRGRRLTLKQRDQLLAEMTDEVGGLVLRDNYLQTQALSVAQAEAPALLDQQAASCGRWSGPAAQPRRRVPAATTETSRREAAGGG